MSKGILIFILTFQCIFVFGETKRILITAPSLEEKYKSFANAYIERVKSKYPDATFILKKGVPDLSSQNPDLIVTIGRKTFESVVADGWKGEIISVYSGRNSRVHNRKNISVINNEPLVKYYVDALKNSTGNTNLRFGILVGISDNLLVDEIEQLKRNGVTISYDTVSDSSQVMRKLERLLKTNRIDVFIVLPNREIYKPMTISNVFFKLFRKKVISSAYSKSFVRDGVGAASSVYYSSNDMLDKMMDLTLMKLEGKESKELYAPESFQYVVNKYMAKLYQLSGISTNKKHDVQK